MRPRRRAWLSLPCPLLVATCCLLSGCRSNCDLVEAELRSREFQLQTLRDELYRLEAHNDALQREVTGLRCGTPITLSPEEASRSLTIRTLVLGRGTGGLDEDGLPGDEALLVVLEPRDGDGHAVKAPGTVHIQALEITSEGLKRPLDSWQATGDALRRSWRAGLLSTGYSLTLPWRNGPVTDRTRVVARLVLSDGRVFEAERDVTVRPLPAELRGPGPALDPPREMPPMPELPPPRKADVPVEPPPPSAPAEPAAHWRRAPRVPLSEAVELLTPVALPQRLEWDD